MHSCTFTPPLGMEQAVLLLGQVLDRAASWRGQAIDETYITIQRLPSKGVYKLGQIKCSPKAWSPGGASSHE